MEDNTKYCIYCGEKIPANAKKCKYCQEWVDESSVTRNHIPNSYTPENNSIEQSRVEQQNNINKPMETSYASPTPTEYSKAIPMRRFYLLMLLTGGLYSIYWFYKNSSYLKDDLGKDNSVGLRTFAFIFVPIANIIVFYELLENMKKFIEEKGIECYSPGLNTLIWLFVPFVGFWVYINVQESFNEFWRIKEPHLPIKRDFSNGEILAMIFGALFWISFIFICIIAIAATMSTV